MRLDGFNITEGRASNSVEVEWFVNKINLFIHHELKVNWTVVELIKVFYNAPSKSCIIRLQINKDYVFDPKNIHLYFMLDFQSKDTCRYGINLEKTISDKGTSITWIQNNEVLVFYPDNRIMELLSKNI